MSTFHIVSIVLVVIVAVMIIADRRWPSTNELLLAAIWLLLL